MARSLGTWCSQRKNKSRKAATFEHSPISMRSSQFLLRAVRVIPPTSKNNVLYTAPILSNITIDDLPNGEFERSRRYHIKRTSNGCWPVYKKVQNTKVSTEVKRIDGDVNLFAEELTKKLKDFDSKKNAVKVIPVSGQVNTRGDFVEDIKAVLDRFSGIKV